MQPISNGELEGVFSVLFYLVGYTVMMFGVFFFCPGTAVLAVSRGYR
jgi:hypothetical protein